MTHTAGLTYGFYTDHPVEAAYREVDLLNSSDLAEFIARLYEIPVRYEPGSRYHYSVATDVLGALIDSISAQPLEDFFQERIIGPLEMNDTFFDVPKEKLQRLANNHYWNAEENRMSVPPPKFVRPYTGVTFFSGGGGLLSCAMDYIIFCDILRKGCSYNGVRILGLKTVQYMTINHLPSDVRNNGADDYPASHLYPGQSFDLGFGLTTDPGQSQGISSSAGSKRRR